MRQLLIDGRETGLQIPNLVDDERDGGAEEAGQLDGGILQDRGDVREHPVRAERNRQALLTE